MITAIILAAGRGSRMKSEEKKQFMMLNGHRVIYYSLTAFAKCGIDKIVLVASNEDRKLCEEAIDDAGLSEMTVITEGGENRYDSVYNGLQKAAGSDFVLIHDGARPAISEEVIKKCIEEVKTKAAVIVAVKAKDTIKITNEEGIIKSTPDRNYIWLAQTPQAFDYNLIKSGFDKMFEDGGEQMITDDAMIVERYMKHPVYVVEGDYRNIKLTTPEDMEVLSLYIEGKSRNDC